MSFLKKIFGDPNKKVLHELEEKVQEINSREDHFQKMSDDEIRQELRSIKEKIKQGDSLDDHLVDVFAITREAAVRVLNMRHYDVQLIGGITLHQGKIAEMRTGEGKTLSATLPVVLNALEGKGVHVITVNDYLAKRDAEWMGKLYNFLELTVGVIEHGQNPQDKVDAYKADITYGTNNEFGFDYLRDNMVQDKEAKVQKKLNYCIVDEVDSILIDEARTPLIISAPAARSTDEYYKFAKLVAQLKENEHYNVDEKKKSATLTDEGITQMEQWLGLSNIYEERGIRTVHHIEQALKAHTLFRKDRDYVVRDGEVLIVDEFTGRIMEGRRYSEGLHQAIEAKENVEIQRESMTLATITFQNFFRLYNKLSGMTGTAATEAEEFNKIYNLDVTVIPTNKEIARSDKDDLIYKSELGKFNAIAERIKEATTNGQPVLVGTASIQKNEALSEVLTQHGIEHNVLNAKNHLREAEIIAQAGKPGSVTVATNMAGRGVDIVLGGSPPSPEDATRVKEAGGLLVIGSERHEARRIDNQLRGRSGRQGDVGESQFFVSTEDDLMRLFGSERMKTVMTTLNIPEEMPIEHKIITRSLESSQKKVEGNNFDIRKHLVEYDDVMNKHREVIYKRRDAILDAWDYEKEVIKAKQENREPQIEKPVKTLPERIFDLIEAEIENVITSHSTKDGGGWDIEEMVETFNTLFPIPRDLRERLEDIHARNTKEDSNEAQTRTEMIEAVINLAKEAYKKKEEEIGSEIMRNIEKTILLQSIDRLWVEHLEDMKALRESIGLRGYGQRDPLVEYKKESFKSFQQLLHTIDHQVVYSIYKVSLARTDQNDTPMKEENMKTSGAKKDEVSTKTVVKTDKDKIGRNDPCYCGSGKKYKKCHGKK